MRTRVISGLVMVALVTTCVLFGAIPFGCVLFFCGMVAVYELSNALGISTEGKKINPVQLIMYLSTIAIYITSFISNKENIDRRMMAIVVIMILLQLSVYVFAFPRYHAKQITAAIFGVLYAPLMLSYGYRIEAFSSHPFIMTGLIFIVSSASDAFAYFVGVSIGKHKLAPVLSPKKSIEGAVGAVILTGLSCMLYVFCSSRLGFMDMKYLWLFALTGVVGSIIAQIGDLAASAFKRNYDIKDYGHLIPGHGGIMDRVDSWIITMPIIYLILQLME